jgi:hypothetical protein
VPTEQIKASTQQSSREILDLYSQATSQDRRLRIDASGKVHLVSGFRRVLQIFRELGKSSAWKENEICTVNIAVMRQLQLLEKKRIEAISQSTQQPSLRDRSPRWLDDQSPKLTNSLPLSGLNTLLTQALDNPTSKQSLGTFRAAMQFCLELRRDPSVIESIYAQATADSDHIQINEQLEAQNLLLEIAPKFRSLSAQIDLQAELRQKFESFQPILKQTLQIIEPYETKLLKQSANVQDLRNGILEFGPDVLSQLRLYAPATLNQSFKILWSRSATNSAFRDLINRVTDATSPYAYETALKRVDDKIDELKHAYALDKLRAVQTERHTQSSQNDENRWLDAIDKMTAIRQRIAANFDVKYPSKWQGSEMARLCGELVSTGPQVCADLLTEVLNSEEGFGSNAVRPDLGARLSDATPALKQILTSVTSTQPFESISPAELSTWDNSLGPLDAQIGALGRRLSAYRSHLATQSSGAPAQALAEYDEAISRLAVMNVLLIMRTTVDFKKHEVARNNPEIAQAWSDKLAIKLNQVQVATAQLLNAQPSPTIVLTPHGSGFLPTIADGHGATRIGFLGDAKDRSFVGQNPNDVEWELALASAWRRVRVSPHANEDDFDQLVAGINFLKSIAV